MNIRQVLLTDKRALEKICLETSAVPLKTEEDKDVFTFRWITNYLQNYTKYCFVSVEDKDVLGYIASTPDSDEQEQIYMKQSSLKMDLSRDILGDLLLDYPGHLHINLTSKARGKGVGSLLMKTMEMKLKSEGVKGVHLGVMSDNEKAVTFYKKNGFKLIKKHILGTDLSTVLFMGKILA